MFTQENITLADKTTMQVGGPARFFCRAENSEDLKEAVLFARKKELPIFVLGEGSNIVMSDEGFNGLVVVLGCKEYIFQNALPDKTEVAAGAGLHWDSLVGESVAKNLHGIENLSLIPGTVGAAPIQNIGAYGSELSDSLAWVEVFDTDTMKIKRLAKNECAFSYRDSIFKHDAGKNFIVTRVGFLLTRNGKVNTEYKDIKNCLIERKIKSPTLSEVRQIVIDIRTNKLPGPEKTGTVGSFFKNPILTKEKYDKLCEKYPNLPGFPVWSMVNGTRSLAGMKIPLAWVLDTVCGLRGFKKGHVGLYEKQPLALVNCGGATAEEIKTFAEFVRKEVYKKIGVVPEYEVSFIK